MRKGTARLLPPAGSVTAREEDRLGVFTVERTDENVCEGRITVSGFFDRVNAGDELVFLPPAQPSAAESPPTRRGLLGRLFGIR